jgi:hypothetical protein
MVATTSTHLAYSPASGSDANAQWRYHERVKTAWGRVDHDTHQEHFIQLEPLTIVIGTQGASPQSGSTGICSHKDFLDGQFHDLIRETFGEEVLAEVIAAVQKAPEHAPFVEYHEEIARLRAFLDAIPFDATLRGLHHREETEDGNRNYGNAGGYQTVVKAENVTLTANLDVQPHWTTFALEKAEGQRIFARLPFPTSHIVAYRDHFFAVMDSTLAVISPDGAMVNDRSVAKMFGEKLRICGVFRFRDIVCYSFHWFSNNYPDGLLRVDLQGRPISRWEPQPGDSGYWSHTT